MSQPALPRMGRRHPLTGRRAGFTLIEMLVVIAVSTLILITVTTTFHALSRTSQRLRTDVAQGPAWARFASQLRRDCHRATGATLESPAVGTDKVAGNQPRIPVLRLVLGDQLIAYQFETNRMLRLESTATTPTTVSRREVFELPGASELEWVVDTQQHRVEWRFQPAPGAGLVAGEGPIPRRSIVAAFGLGGGL